MRLINKMLNFWCAKADSIRQSPCGDGSGGGHKVYFVAVYARDFTLSYHQMRPCGLPTTATNQKTTLRSHVGIKSHVCVFKPECDNVSQKHAREGTMKKTANREGTEISTERGHLLAMITCADMCMFIVQ